MKDILGFEGLYAVTEDGKVWSYPKKWNRKHGIPASHKGKWLKPTNVVGYLEVSLYKNNKRVRKYVHRLVADAFLLRTLEVNHKNGVRTDNRIENLEWVTPSQNALHAKQKLKVGHARGERAGHAKLTDDIVREMRRLRSEDGLLYKEIAMLYKVDSARVSRIINRQIWSHVE